MARILAVADEIDHALYGAEPDRLRPDLLVSCGDLRFDYLEYLATRLNVPLVYVPGNHDPDLRDRPALISMLTPQLRPEPDRPQRPGGINVDIQVVDVGPLRVAGLGGSLRYREGPNQYTQSEMTWRARRLRLRAATKRFRDGRGVDVLLTHAPPFGLGDEDDPAHIGIKALHRLVETLSPSLLLHGHIHPYGRERPDRQIGITRVVNVVPSRMLEVEP